jgi:stage V sporulation protein G
MQLSEIRISLCPQHSGRLKAFCSLTFDNTFVIRDVKLIEGNDGLFLAMPARKLCDRCKRCGEKNHLRARYCNNCGLRLDENRYMKMHHGNGGAAAGAGGAGHHGHGRLKLHADIAHPIHPGCRQEIEQKVLAAYREELEKSKQPGYQPLRIEDDFEEFHHDDPSHPHPTVHVNPSISSEPRLRPTGTTAAH